MEFTNTTLLYGMFNRFVFSEAKMNISLVKMYYRSKFLYGKNTLITRLINLIEEYPYKDLTEARFLLTLQSDGKTLDEAIEIYSKIKEFQDYDITQSKPFVENLKEICYLGIDSYCRSKHPDSMIKYLEEAKKFEYKTSYADNFVILKGSEVDLTDIVARKLLSSAKSRYDVINNSFTGGGYPGGAVVVIAGAPATGKSLFLMSEATHFITQGKRVHYLVLGDLQEDDIMVRAMCQLERKSKREIENDVLGNLEKYRSHFSNLNITILPANSITSEQYIEAIMSRIDEFDILMVDYDSNFQGASDEESMYNKGGLIYDNMTKISNKGKLVFIASQIKTSYASSELIPMEALAESGRKYQVADLVITLGKKPDKDASFSRVPCGTINIAKSRRGEPGRCYWIRTNEGLFYVPSKDFYDRYSNVERSYVYSYAEYEEKEGRAGTEIVNKFKDTLIENKK